MHSRPRRRYTLEYLGKTVQEMRVIRDFLQVQRFGAGTVLQFVHPNAWDLVPASNTTPIILTFQHEFVTGQWVNIGNTGLAGIWRVSRVSPTQLALDGTSASGAVTVSVYAYLPAAVARFSDDIMESPVKVRGTDHLGPDRPGETRGALAGRFSWTVQIEEVF
jgi:hypothetical protein